MKKLIAKVNLGIPTRETKKSTKGISLEAIPADSCFDKNSIMSSLVVLFIAVMMFVVPLMLLPFLAPQKDKVGVSFEEAQQIYARIIKVNHIKDAPTLLLLNVDFINAYSLPTSTTITNGLLKAGTKDEIALVLGHELSHFKFKHWYNPWMDSEAHKVAEADADVEGADMMKEAGYNLCKGIHFFKVIPKSGGTSHPDSDWRYNRLMDGCDK